MAQMVKRLSTMQETQVWSLGGEDPREKKTAAHSSTLAWKTPRTEKPGRLLSMGSQRVRHDWAASLSLSLIVRSVLIHIHFNGFIELLKVNFGERVGDDDYFDLLISITVLTGFCTSTNYIS